MHEKEAKPGSPAPCPMISPPFRHHLVATSSQLVHAAAPRTAEARNFVTILKVLISSGPSVITLCSGQRNGGALRHACGAGGTASPCTRQPALSRRRASSAALGW